MLRISKFILAATFGGGVTAYTLDYKQVIDLSNYNFPFTRELRTGLKTASIICDYKYSLYNLQPGTEKYETEKAKAHERSADKIFQLCWRNRAAYLKVGQLLGSMDYLLPYEYTQKLKVLHSNAPQSTFEEIESVLKEDLNIVNIHDVFSEFDKKPIGTASLAQVYKAKLKNNNSTVAVKVQHYSVRALADHDMNVMESSLKWIKYWFPDFNLMWLAEETRRNLPLELDFRHEAKNCAEATDNLKCFDWVKLPKIYWNFCTERVLVMEYFEGGQVDDAGYLKEHSIDFSHVSKLLGKLFSEMIFVHGFVHSDPHPGNVLVRWKKQDPSLSILQRIKSFFYKTESLELVLLDHGLYRRLSKDFRFHYASLWQSIINTDVEGMERHGRAIGGGDMFPLLATIVSGRAWKVVGETGIVSTDFTKNEDTAIRDGAGRLLPDISHVLANVSSEMLLVLKANDHLRGLEFSYGVRGHSSGFLNMSRCCMRALYELQVKKETGLTSLIHHKYQLYVGLLKINLYEWYLWFQVLLGHKKPSIAAPTKNLRNISKDDVTKHEVVTEPYNEEAERVFVLNLQKTQAS